MVGGGLVRHTSRYQDGHAGPGFVQPCQYTLFPPDAEGGGKPGGNTAHQPKGNMVKDEV